MLKENSSNQFIVKCIVILCLSVSVSNDSHAEISTKAYARIDSLNEEGARLYKIDFNLSFQIASRALELSIQNNYEKGIVWSTCRRSLIESNTNKCKEALRSLSLLLPTVLRDGDSVTSLLLYSTIGMCWFYHGNYDSARFYQIKAIQTGIPSTKNYSLYAHAYANLSKGYMKTGNPLKAKEYCEKAVAIFDKISDRGDALWAQELLGELFYTQRLYEKALACLDKSYHGFSKLGHLHGSTSALLFRGNANYMLMRDDRAEADYTEALKSFTILGDTNGMAMCYSNLSRVYLEKRNHTKSIWYADRALGVIRPGNYANIEAGTYQQLGDIYGEVKKYDMAVAHIHKALSIARTIDDKTAVKDCYKSLSELYEVMKKPELAMKSLLAAYRLKDSIQPVAFTRQLAEMEAQYETEKKRTEIDLLKKDGQINTLKLKTQEGILKRQRYVLAMLVIIIGIISLTVYYYLAKKKLMEQVTKQNIIRETEETERMRIAKDIHDELGSGLSKIRFLSELAATKTETTQQIHESFQSISETSKGLVENMRDLVWAMNPENTTLDNLVARIREYSYDYLEEFPVEVEFDFPETIPEKKISKQVNRNIYMIVKEALQNIVKHADASKVLIRIALPSKFKLEISDNGKGYDNRLKTEGNGLKNIQARSQALAAKLTLNSDLGGGSKLELELDMWE